MSIEARLVYNYQVAITNGRHSLVADEPISAGGTDIGFDPYQLVLSGLAACKAITAKMYADRKNWPLDSVNITITHQKVRAAECEECSSATGTVDLIACDLEFIGDLDDQQKLRLLDISERCPVQRSLQSETIIRSRQAIAVDTDSVIVAPL